jgi:seryl-tRNA synthetase
MLDIQFIRQNADEVRGAIKNKGLDLSLDALLEADKLRREATRELEERRARKNELSSLIPKATKEDRPRLVDEAKQVRGDIERLEPGLADLQRRFQDLMLRVPSIPRPEVPIGRGEESNVEIRRVGAPRSFDFQPTPMQAPPPRRSRACACPRARTDRTRPVPRAP